ncbi:chromate transporter [Roseomonas sp. OT10]|uniref:chromate transporter n=1 Tax=Roseomonas cutis TaxID=2897332 RepID=UPI001E431223|nr:chromate transporter [Roseomonas sp. OT10]UFN47329.1 chromate transporter [Roseomonas sp. OT10]
MTTTAADVTTVPPPAAAPPGSRELFLGYLRIGLFGFGGVNAWSRHVIVEERHWLSEREYAELLGLGQVLPGPNVGNAAIMLGRRFGGLRGAVATTAGLYAMPLAILVILAGLWERFGSLPPVQGVMAGVAAAAAGMTLGNALRMGERLRLPLPMVGLALLTVLAAAWFRVPLPLIVLGLGLPGIWLAWRGP